jgi:hypothetical protein
MAINDPATGAAAIGGPAGTMAGMVGLAQAAVAAGISARSLDQAKQAAEGMKNAAASGHLRITPEGFDILIKAINDCEDHMRAFDDTLTRVTQAPMLGSSPYARTVAAHVQRGGTGETQSADIVVRQLGAVFAEVREALIKAKQAYEDNEHATVRKLK